MLVKPQARIATGNGAGKALKARASGGSGGLVKKAVWDEWGGGLQNIQNPSSSVSLNSRPSGANEPSTPSSTSSPSRTRPSYARNMSVGSHPLREMSAAAPTPTSLGSEQVSSIANSQGVESRDTQASLLSGVATAGSAPATHFAPNVAIPVHGRLYWAAVRGQPRHIEGEVWFSTDRVLHYQPFCADFGPMNLACVSRFMALLREKLQSPATAGRKVVYYTANTPPQRSNCVFLLGCYLVLEEGMAPEDASSLFSSLEPAPFVAYRDATFARSTYDLSLLDCWRGLKKGVDNGFINMATFNAAEYEYYDHPAHGDMHILIPGKVLAFKGPSGRRQMLAPGLFSHTPKDYLEVFRHKKVSAVVRLNNREYDRNDFVRAGLRHYDLYFDDCTTPTDAIVHRFFSILEREPGVVAVHCLAGLGRTGTLIALWMMTRHGFTANEAIGYLRILRPGSVIGPQ
eukprot:CAMPEP_0172005172 /NCGR_PEP_ID=MMETSP1041-20130122/4891_1 /TAXON_ID=464988 /ORGANISM="Hemiselmis andersenii, Strain CCMP439" /LENGTH=457 /DNA_ID=CAMNT_0012659121 /DNA_START=1706 /DNA_END=3076 /DNA_ORIENTATION=+